jgi:hypothetical protein
MPRFMLMLRDDRVPDDAVEDWEAHFQKFVVWAEKLHKEGRLAGVQRLKPPAEGRTVRTRAGSIVVDGPFVEGKEAVLGFYVIDAADRAEAERIAAECPSVPLGGSVEVRELDWFPTPA